MPSTQPLSSSQPPIWTFAILLFTTCVLLWLSFVWAKREHKKKTWPYMYLVYALTYVSLVYASAIGIEDIHYVYIVLVLFVAIGIVSGYAAINERTPRRGETSLQVFSKLLLNFILPSILNLVGLIGDFAWHNVIVEFSAVREETALEILLIPIWIMALHKPRRNPTTRIKYAVYFAVVCTILLLFSIINSLTGGQVVEAMVRTIT